MRKKANGDGSIYRAKDGGWKAVLSLGAGPDGRRVRKVRRASTREEARRKLAVMQDQYGQPGPLEGTQTTVAQVFARWLRDDVAPNLSPSTHANYSMIVENYILPVIGRLAVGEVRHAHITEMLARLREGSRIRQSSYVVCSLGFKFAFLSELIDVNPCTRVRRPSYIRREIEVFTDAEVDAILTHTQGSPYHALYRLAFTFGPRQCEIFALRWGKIDWQAREIRIDESAIENSGRVTFKAPKTRSGVRTIRVTPAVLDALQELRKRALKAGRAGKDDLVFTARDGNVIRASNFRGRHWGPLLKRLGIRHRGFHHARHTAVTAMLNDGLPANTVAGIVGHGNGTITLGIYGHFVANDQERAVKIIEARRG